jgi:hypothetical protein
MICPTAQAKYLRQIGTTGKSVEIAKLLSSEEQLLRRSSFPATNAKRQKYTTVIARSESDEAIQIVSPERFWIASLTLAMTASTHQQERPRRLETTA